MNERMQSGIGAYVPDGHTGLNNATGSDGAIAERVGRLQRVADGLSEVRGILGRTSDRLFGPQSMAGDVSGAPQAHEAPTLEALDSTIDRLGREVEQTMDQARRLHEL